MWSQARSYRVWLEKQVVKGYCSDLFSMHLECLIQNSRLGEEYSYILKNIDSYCKKFNFAKFPNKTHPPSIYTEPQSNI